MSNTSQQCPKCNGQMERGFILDQVPGGQIVSRWIAGEPQKSFWTGIKRPEEKGIPIGAFRCAACGFLESYARDEFAAN
jgi:hypothetical protein